MNLSDLYVQLYSLRHEIAIQPEQTLRTIPGLGFKGVELAGDYGWHVDRWRSILNETGLTVVASHQGLEALENNLAERISFHRALGTSHLIVPGLNPSERQSADGYRGVAKRLNVIGSALRSEGFALSYHNHDFELTELATNFSPFRCGMDVLLAETDPAIVSFEIDTFWIEYAGLNAAEFIRNNASRVALIHAKDMRRRDRRDVPVGQGDVDFPAVLPLCSANEWPVVVEYEGRDALNALRQGSLYLRSLPR